MTNTTCPRCSGPMHGREVMNSLSRVPGGVYICSPCGQLEALFNLRNPGQPLPPVDQKLEA